MTAPLQLLPLLNPACSLPPQELILTTLPKKSLHTQQYLASESALPIVQLIERPEPKERAVNFWMWLFCCV